MSQSYIIDVHDVMSIVSNMAKLAPDYVHIVPEMVLGEIITVAQTGRMGDLSIIPGVIVMRESFDVDVYRELVSDFICLAAELLANRLAGLGIDGYLTDYMLMPNQRDLILRERVNNGRFRISGGAH